MRLPVFSALTISALIASGCYVDVNEPGTNRTRSGDLTIRYTFDGLECDAAGVDRIDIAVVGETRNDRYDDSLRCDAFRHGVTIENLREDQYRVRIGGRTANGTLAYEVRDSIVGVVAYSHQEYDLDVAGETVETGDLTVYWTFEGRGSCGAVTDVRVRLVDPAGFVYDDSRYPCDYEGVVFEAIKAGNWTVSIDGISSAGRVLYGVDNQRVSVIANSSNTYDVDLGEVR